ncbi:MAG: hypothetical protein AMXMBFR48_14500 [Ignavibacteriales bacterium]
MYHYLLKPSDVLSFRDGKPFGSAEEHNIILDFPPSPATFYGALRSSVLAVGVDHLDGLGAMTDELKTIIGAPGKPGALEIKSLLFHHQEKGFLFPAPTDLVKKKKTAPEQKTVLHRMILKELPGDAQFNFPEGITKILEPENDIFVEGVDGYLTLPGLTKYLTGDVPADEELLGTGDVYVTENRVGIGRSNATRTVKPGALFTIEFARLQNKISFYAELSHKPGTKSIKLGGEGRTCSVEPIESRMELHFNEMRAPNGIKVIIVTPLCSEKGWYPDDLMQKKLEEATGTTLQLKAAAIKRHRSIGGWDIVLNRPKTMRRYIPEGSVFYFSSEKQLSIKPRLFNLSSSEDEKKQGFGLTLLGGF